MLTVRTSENTVITSFRLITERQDFSSVRTGENTVRARARIQCSGLLNREEVWLLVEFLKIKFPLRFSIEKRELLVRGHPLRKLEEPSRYIRISEGTHGGRRRLFRS